MLGLWAAVTWQLLGAPAPVLLAEAGPGRGTLMADALRADARVAPDFRAALRLHLIETSPRLRAAQAERAAGRDLARAARGTCPTGPLLLLANEFLDALPIRQFVRRGGGWTERFVAAAGFVEQPADLDADADEPDGAVDRTLRRRPGLIAAHLGARFAADGGRRAVPRLRPGTQRARRQPAGDRATAARPTRWPSPAAADLTAHVDFAALAASAARAPAPRCTARCRRGCSSPGSACSSAPTALARGQPPRAAARA